MRKATKSLLVIVSFVFIAAGCNRPPVKMETTSPQEQSVETQINVEFSELNSSYKFSGKVDNKWKVEYVAASDSINIFDPTIEAESSLEQSQIFIRYFRANDFLTLTTVDILSKEATEVSGHPAVRYEIKKKAGVANFTNQPLWRSGQHKLIDIRHSETNPSIFYVFAYNPVLPSSVFEEFISSLEFQ
jgi:hypothetical protein